MANKLRILIIHLEFGRWRQARSWSYHAQLGFSEGMAPNGVDSLVLLNPYGGCPPNRSWQDTARKIIAGRKFDQVWMEVVHSNYDAEFLAFVSGLARVRVAILCESMLYGEDVLMAAPHLRERWADVKGKLRYFTHVLAYDEEDVGLVERECGLPAMWLVLGMPQWSVISEVDIPVFDTAVFSGPVYGDRDKFLRNDDLAEYMLHLPPLENETSWPSYFDHVNRSFGAMLRFCPLVAVKINGSYLKAIWEIRKKLHQYWIDGLRRGVAVVQLPHFVSAFPGRIFEGMAAGRPVITMALQNRPRTMRLFEAEKEILFYRTSEELIDRIKLVRDDKARASEIAANATKKLKTFYSVELRVKQVLEWLETGKEPRYYE